MPSVSSRAVAQNHKGAPTVTLAHRHREAKRMPSEFAGVASAPAAVAMNAGRAGQTELFDVSVFDNSFATEFSIAKPIDVPSSGQRVAMSLGQHEDKAKLAVRTSPPARFKEPI